MGIWAYNLWFWFGPYHEFQEDEAVDYHFPENGTGRFAVSSFHFIDEFKHRREIGL